jgi:hypothetical protein
MVEQIRKTRKDFGAVVPARSGRDIESIALGVRTAMGLSEAPYFPIVWFYDLLHKLIPGAYYDIRPREEMGDNHGLTHVRRKEIQIRQDVFEAACRDDGFGRFTMCHELGHLLMHRGGLLQRGPAKPPIYMSSEWQSDYFAGALLMPSHLVDPAASPQQIARGFCTSVSAAEVRLNQVNQQKRKGL